MSIKDFSVVCFRASSAKHRIIYEGRAVSIVFRCRVVRGRMRKGGGEYDFIEGSIMT